MKKSLFRRVAIVVLTAGLPAAAWADVSGTVTLSAGTALNLDTGTTSSSGGDILWTGTQMNFQGSAAGGVLPAILGFSGESGFTALTQATLQALSMLGAASNAPIPSSALPVGTIFALLTNGGNSAKVLVTANSGGSIGLQFDTFESGSTTTPSGPSVTNVENGSSTIPPGFPNSGVAPSSLIVIHGTGMSNAGTAVLQDTTKGLPLSLNGASVAVTVNGTTVHPALYYTDSNPSQIAAVLPAATPVGTGTITVTYNNVPSAPAPIQVVASAPGIDTYDGSGVATDAVTGALLTYTASGKPGETIILWGTGLGADPADSDTTYTSTPHQTSVPLQVYVGGVLATVVYQGASVYPGVDVIGLTLPASVPTGCYVSLAAVVGNVVSNVVSLPIAAAGGVCTDSEFGINGTQISTLSGQSTVSSGSVYVIQTTSPGTTAGTTQVNDLAAATFEQVTGTSYAGSGTVSIGGCSLNQTVVSGAAPNVTGLDAGTITVTGPSGGPVTLTSAAQLPGLYFAQLASGAIPASGGTFAFHGAGGSVVGPFTATVNFPNPLLSWTNQSAAATVTRSQGLNVTWSGGAAGSYVSIGGTSTSSNVSASYTCIAPQSAGQFTVPAYILLAMPAGTGTTSVENSTSIGSFSATGINAGVTFGAVSVSTNSTYQ